MLILVGISINSLLGSNGILKKVQQARQEYVNEQEKEEIEIAKYTNEINNYISNSRGETTPMLLWTNEDPNSNFIGQTLSIDLSEYRYVIVIMHPWIGSNNYPRTAAFLPVSDNESENWKSVNFGAASTSRIRTIQANTSGVIISNEINKGENNELIPLYIYGIKSDLGIWNAITGE